MFSVLRVYGNVADLFTGSHDYSSLPMEICLKDPKARYLSIDLSHADDWEEHIAEMEGKLNILEEAVPELMSDSYHLVIDTALDTPEDKQARGLNVVGCSYRFGFEFLAMLIRRKIDLDVTIYLSMKPEADE
jgi:hypothetical protein